MTNSFRIEATELQGWHAALAARMELRGVPAIAKEIEAHLAKKDADGSVVVTRHQLFTWAEALQGVAQRDTRGASAGVALSIPQIVADMRGILGGKPVEAAIARGAPSTEPAPLPAAPVPASSRPAYAPPPAVVYGAPSSASGGAGGSVVSGAQLGEAARDLIRSARTDLFVISPWDTGLETLVADIAALPPNVRVLIVSRRPAQDTPAYHQGLDQLGRRRAVTAFSPHIQTRMIVQDDARALVGAASVPGPASREVGVVISDRATVAALRAQFERTHSEAAGPQR